MQVFSHAGLEIRGGKGNHRPYRPLPTGAALDEDTMNRLNSQIWIASCSLVASLGCGSSTSTASKADAASTADSAGDSTPTGDASGDSTPTGDTSGDSKGGDAQTSDSKASDTTAFSCAQAAGAWAVTGTCSNGGGSIPYACMKVKDCTATWETDFRDWTGSLTGADYHLKNAAGSESIDGHFDDGNSGSYTFKGGSLTCDATMVRYSSTASDQLCCDVIVQDCVGPGQGCVPMLEGDVGAEIVTTGCLALADNATTSEGAACDASGLPLSCGKGLLCIKGNGGQGTCAKLCISAGNCGASQNCVIASGAPKAGVCETACTPLAGNNSCGDGQFCGPAAAANAAGQRVMAGACSAAGTTKFGGPCQGSGECKADSLCISGVCAPQCDDSHPCDVGTCTGFGLDLAQGMPANFGYCKP